MGEKFAVYTLCNDLYIEIVAIMIFSFIYNNNWFDGDIIVLCDDGKLCGLSEGSRDYLRSIYGKIIFKEIDHDQYTYLFQNAERNGINPNYLMLYYKLEAFKTDDYDRKLLLDADVVVNKSIRELFLCSESRILVVEDQLKTFCNYYNSGVMSIPKSAIDENLFNTLIRFGETFDKHSFSNAYSNFGESCDQDILNEVVNNVRFIGGEYNVAPFRNEIPYERINEQKIIHYYGGNKPWLEHCEFKPAYLFYYRYYYMLNHYFRAKKTDNK